MWDGGNKEKEEEEDIFTSLWLILIFNPRQVPYVISQTFGGLTS